MANLVTMNILWNRVVSILHAKYVSNDVKIYYQYVNGKIQSHKMSIKINPQIIPLTQS